MEKELQVFLLLLITCIKWCTSVVICNTGELCVDGKKFLCKAGHYCIPGDTKATPCPIGTYSTEEGLWKLDQCKQCLRGHYCNSEGLVEPMTCPKGKMMPYTGASRCFLCTPGFYCNSYGLHSPSGPCLPGYYCKAGSKSNQNAECPPGNYCPLAASKPLPCKIGTYSNVVKSTNCRACEYGHFCPKGSVTPIPCPSGTYGEFMEMISVYECEPCPAGFYCFTNGLSEPSGACPRGHYCPGHTTNPIPCAAGTVSNKTGNAQQNNCLPCPAGFYCSDEGLTEPSGVCNNGYYCPNGSTNATSYKCPVGSYCPSGSIKPILCPKGTFGSQPGLINVTFCELCTNGYYCPNEGSTEPTNRCPKGYFCPLGSAAPELCPKSTTSNIEGLSQEEDCQLCPSGYYCPSPLRTPIPCPAGTYGDVKGLTNVTHCKKCIMGSFCKPGSSLPTPCMSGTYSNETGSTFCYRCPVGYYCAGEGLIAPTRKCRKGYYCPKGSMEEQKCPEGTFTDTEGSAECSIYTEDIGSGGTTGYSDSEGEIHKKEYKHQDTWETP